MDFTQVMCDTLVGDFVNVCSPIPLSMRGWAWLDHSHPGSEGLIYFSARLHKTMFY